MIYNIITRVYLCVFMCMNVRKFSVRSSQGNYFRVLCNQSSKWRNDNSSKRRTASTVLETEEDVEATYTELFNSSETSSSLSQPQLDFLFEFATVNTPLWKVMHLNRVSSSNISFLMLYGDKKFIGDFCMVDSDFDYVAKAAAFIKNCNDAGSLEMTTLARMVKAIFWREEKKLTQEQKNGVLAEPIILDRVEEQLEREANVLLGLCDDQRWNFVRAPGFSINSELQQVGSTTDRAMSVKLPTEEEITYCIECKFSKYYKSQHYIEAQVDQCLLQCMNYKSPACFLVLADSSTSLNSAEAAAAICDFHIMAVERNPEWEKLATHYIRLSYEISNQLIAQGTFTPPNKTFKLPRNLKEALLIPGEDYAMTRKSYTQRISGCHAEIIFAHWDGKALIPSTLKPKRLLTKLEEELQINKEEADVLRNQVRMNGTAGWYFLRVHLNHEGCKVTRPHHEYNDEKLLEIKQEMYELADKGMKAEDIQKFIKKKYGLKRGIQDVKNYISEIKLLQRKSEGTLLMNDIEKMQEELRKSAEAVCVALYYIYFVPSEPCSTSNAPKVVKHRKEKLHSEKPQEGDLVATIVYLKTPTPDDSGNIT